MFNKFSCKKNLDVENFLKNTAIRFEKADKARTYIIVPKDKPRDENGNIKIFAYFSISTKNIEIPKELSKTTIKKLDGIDKNATEIKCYLIGQLAKNDVYVNDLKGDDIVDYALNMIQKCYEIIGMRVILVECEDKEKLIQFYETNNFKSIGKDSNTQLLQFVRTITTNKNIEITNILGQV